MAEFQSLTRKMRRLFDRSGSWLEAQFEKLHFSKWVGRHVTFYRLHVSYFLGLATLAALVLWLSQKSSEREISLVDAIFNSTSILTITGLLTIRMADLSLGNKLFSLVLMTLGSHTFTSLLPLYVRRYYFHRHHKQLVQQSLEDRVDEAHETDMIVAQKEESPGRQVEKLCGSSTAQCVHDQGMDDKSESQKLHQNWVSLSKTNDHLNHSATLSENIQSKEEVKHVPQSPAILQMSLEHQSLVTLCRLVPNYIIVVQLLSFALSEIYFVVVPTADRILRIRGVNSIFFSFFTSVSSFTNSGVPIHDDNMVPFQRQHFLLLLFTTVSLSGNLLYPLCLRLVILSFHRIAPETTKPVYNYLLQHPRRCYTHLFPGRQTAWLALTLVGFTALQLIFFCSLDWQSVALNGLDPFSKIVAGVYQSVSVRNSGGAVVGLGGLVPTMLVLYTFMMYIAAYPIVLLRQNSTVYDETDIAVFQGTKRETELTDNSLKFQAKKLLAKDSAYLCIILFVICLIESDKIANDPLNFSIFNIIFEVVSAYGGVGMSVGYSCALRLARSSPCEDVPYSFSGKWSPAGKLILTAVMLMGRHRGLPDDIDSAIKLPSFEPHSHTTSRKNSISLPSPDLQTV